MFGIFGWVILGVLLAIASRLALRVKDPDGMLVTVLIGIAGALLGGFLSVAMELVDFGERASLLAALVGAVLTLSLKTWAVRHESRTR